MSVIDAVYQGGVFRPTTPPDLPDGTAVRIAVLSDGHDVPGPTDPDAVLARIQAITARARVTGTAETTARDHDTILYGGPEGVR